MTDWGDEPFLFTCLQNIWQFRTTCVKVMWHCKHFIQKEITDVKIAFADNAYKIISSSATKQSYASVAGGSHQEGKAILIAEATKPIDIGGMMAGQPPRF
jgi:hypothetical protein